MLRTASALWDRFAESTQSEPHRFTVTALELVPWPSPQGEIFNREPSEVQALIDTVRSGEETPAVIDAQPARVEAVVGRARDHGVDLLLIDTAGRTEQAALAGACVADLVLVPLQPSVVDLDRVCERNGLSTPRRRGPRSKLFSSETETSSTPPLKCHR